MFRASNFLLDGRRASRDPRDFAFRRSRVETNRDLREISAATRDEFSSIFFELARNFVRAINLFLLERSGARLTRAAARSALLISGGGKPMWTSAADTTTTLSP